MYDKSDPRASLAPAAAQGPQFTKYHPSQYVRFYEGPPQLSDGPAPTWLARGQNAITALSETSADAHFERKGQVDEWVLLLPDSGLRAELIVEGQSHTISGGTVTFVPPGNSDLRVLSEGRIVRFFTTRSSDLAELCANAEAYREDDPKIPPFQPWPIPPDGFKVRSYSLDVAEEPDHVEHADASVTVIAMIEDPEALDVIDEIISIEGLDGIFIGRGDLTVAMRANGPTDQRVRSATERIIAAAHKVRKPVCILVGNAKEAADWRSLGANSFIVASDQGFMRQAAARTRTEFSELVVAACRHGQVGTTAEIPSNL